MKGAQAIVKSLIKHNADVTFGITGGVLIPLFDAFLEEKDKIRNILTRHEQGAAHAAEGYARASGKAGVCIATSGPGATNLLTGIMDAYMDSVPIIAMGGQVATGLIGNDAFQETDMMGLTLPITKHNYQLRDPNKIASTIMKAFRLATEGRPGPVYIDMPVDISKAKVTKPFPKEVKIEGFNPTLNPNPKQVRKAADLMLNSERPLFIAGGGIISANASKEFTQLATMLNIPVSTTMQGKGCFDERHPLSVGMVGMHGKKIANYAQVNADLLIAIGVRFSDRITGNLSSYAENAKVIHVDIDPAEIGKNVRIDVPIVGDAKQTIIALTDVIKKLIKKGKTSWTKKILELKKSCEACMPEPKGKIIHPRQVMKAFNSILKQNDIVTTGVGQHQMFAAHYLKRSNPRTFISSGGAGTMGFGFPAAIGAKVAKPKENVICLDGDGSFQMTIQELGTISENDIKVTPIIFNNKYLGMVRQWLELFFDRRYSQVYLGKSINFGKIAEAYGLKSTVIERVSELKEKIQQAIKSDTATVVDVHIEEESNVLPMLPPGGHLRDAFGKCIKAQGEFF